MPKIAINGQTIEVPVGTLVLDACKQVGIDIPHYCYHPALTPVATCRMCMVEIKGMPKLATSCTTTVGPAPKDLPDGLAMEIFTNTPQVADARAGVMEFLLMNHPLDCPICDQAGECKLQDYSYAYGSGDSRMHEAKRRYRYEDLGGKIVIDKNRCIHCTRCIRFTQEISGGSELTVAQRGADLEVTTYSGKSLDANPYAANVVDICPVGALTSRDFRFKKRVWYLTATPSICRESALAAPVWMDHEGNHIYRMRPRPIDGQKETHFISDRERYSYKHYNRQDRPTRIVNQGSTSASEVFTQALQNPTAVVAQGTIGCDAAQKIAECASSPNHLYGSGDRQLPIDLAHLQHETDGVINRKGLEQRGYRFGQLAALKKQIEEGQIKTVILVHDELVSSDAEAALLKEILQLASTSIVFEVLQSPLGQLATLWIPMTSYVEENDFVINLRGEICRYQKVLKAPEGCSTVIQWVQSLRSSSLAATPS